MSEEPSKLGAPTAGPFDYGVVDTEAADFARQAVGRIRAHERAAAVDIGRELIAVKGRLGHGHFLAWIAAEFGWSRRTATNMMQVAHEFGDDWEKVAHLPKTLQYRIASPSNPQIVRDIIHGQRPGALMDAETVKATLNGYVMGAWQARFIEKHSKPEVAERLLAKIAQEKAEAAQLRAEAARQEEVRRKEILVWAERIRIALGERLSEFQSLVDELGSDVIVETLHEMRVQRTAA